MQARNSQHLITTILAHIPQEMAGPKVSGDDQQVIMTLLVETFKRSALMVTKTPPPLRKKMLAEVTLIMNGYLDNYR